MNRIPADVDISVLNDHTLEMICFNANQIYFHFDGHISIVAETNFKYEQSPGGNDTSEISIPATQSDLMKLLEHRVSNSLIEEQHILTIVFDNGHVLRFSDTAPGLYESYRLTIGNRTIIV
jgi:hypothetical protein